jgi:hypothetical protein
MAYMTRAQASAYGVRRLGSVTASAQLAYEALNQTKGPFDIFLSHSYVDAKEVLGVKRYLEDLGYRVYVDWLIDRQLSRENVTAATADLLRTRMQESKSMVVVASASSADSRWIPWELGYFDGRSNGRIAIFPLVEHSDDSWVGREYLGLYPAVVEFPAIGTDPQVRNFRGRTASLHTFARAA